MSILTEKISLAVKEWRKDGYPNASLVSRRLLEFWFKEEHLLGIGDFKFWRCQQEAIESLIYLYEVCRYQSLYEIARNFQVSIKIDPTTDLWPKYCFKMATGSGKTFVMALSVVWQYFNKIFARNNGLGYSSHFLMLAPNLIVLDRLKEAFADNQIFRGYPFIPPEWQQDFNLQLIFQSEKIPVTASGVIYLTNVQQFYKRQIQLPVNPLDELLGEKPKSEEEINYESLKAELGAYDNLLIINDEAHHVHSDDLEWNKIIADLNEATGGLAMQLDFSATPKNLQGKLFPHMVYNYSLAQAISDGIVKRPRIGEIVDAPDLSKEQDFVKKNQLQIDIGMQILREFQKNLHPLGKKPVLFIMTDKTRNADKVGAYLERQGFGGKVLVIHTNKAGVITKKDLNKARQAAREIDKIDNPYEVIVSVMMLKEGWDVKNVCVIVPLRAFDSPILPEQTLGRGLRRIFPRNSELTERLIVIDHPRFRQLWEAEIDSGELVADLVSSDRAYQPDQLVIVDVDKIDYDFQISIVSGGLTRVVPDLSKLDIRQLPKQLFKLSEVATPQVMYREKDLLEQKIVREMILAFDYTENFSLYLSYICQAIAAKVGIRSIFVDLVPLVKDYIIHHLFDSKFISEDVESVKKLNHILVREKIVEVFSQAVNELSQKIERVKLSYKFWVSQTQPFHTSEPVHPAKKTVFNQLPYPKSGPFEQEFMQYLDGSDRVLAFTKIFRNQPLYIPYHDFEGYLHYYLPDFVIKTEETMYLIETKGGLEPAEVVLKDEAAKNWCQTVSQLTSKNWQYLKVRPENINNLNF